jgi:hypothetical protein
MHLPLGESPLQQPNKFGRAKARALFVSLCLAIAAGVFVPGHAARAAIGFVQVNTGECAAGPCTSTTIAFTSNNTAGNLIVVGFYFDDTVNVSSVTDTQGNVYVRAGTQVHSAALSALSDIYYAKNIIGGANAVTVTLSGPVGLTVFIHEYSGLDQNFPLDVTASSTGNSTTLDSGLATTNFANELIFGWGPNGQAGIISAGSGFTTRSTFNSLISEDKTVSAIGPYDAVATMTVSTGWIMQMATFKAASPGIQVSSRSDILSNSQPSATSNHTIAFKVNNAIYGSSTSNSSTLTLTLDPNFNIPVGMDCGDVDAATSVQFGFNYPACQATATAWGFSAMGSVITLVPPSGTGVYVPTSTQVTIKIGSNATVGQQGAHWITNPSAGGVYTISVGGTFGGSGNMLVSINAGVQVSATVAESLSFTVSPSVSSVKMVQIQGEGGNSDITVNGTGSGNLLVVGVTNVGGTVTGITDNASGGPNTYASANVLASDSNSGTTTIWYAKNSRSGATDVTLAGTNLTSVVISFWAHALRYGAIACKVWSNEDRRRTQSFRSHSRHGRAHAESPRLIGGSADD